MEQFKWNYILEDDADEDLKDEDNGEDDKVGGPVEKMWYFQMAPIPLLIVWIYSNRS